MQGGGPLAGCVCIQAGEDFQYVTGVRPVSYSRSFPLTLALSRGGEREVIVAIEPCTNRIITMRVKARREQCRRKRI